MLIIISYNYREVSVYIENVSKLIKRLDNISFLGIKNLKRKIYGAPDYDNDIFVWSILKNNELNLELGNRETSMKNFTKLFEKYLL